MTRKPKERRFTRRLEILLADNQYDHLATLNGGLGFHVRSMIDSHMGHYNKEEDELRKRMAVVEPEYFAIKKRLVELEEIKMQEKGDAALREKQVEEAHEGLLDALKNSHNRIEKVSESAYKIYSDHCGIPVAELKAWLKAEAEKRSITG